MKIQKQCRMCGTVKVIEVSDEGYALWRDGVHIQDALPELSEDDRELLISGVCGSCYDALFSDEE